MNSNLKWSEGMAFTATSSNHSVVMDAKAPLGQDKGMTPKEMVLAGLGGCTAMDVIALLKKHKQPLESLFVDVQVETSKSGYPMVFESAVITFTATGNIDGNILTEAVVLSQTKYCGVSAMLVKAFPISFVVILNNQKINEGKAHFN